MAYRIAIVACIIGGFLLIVLGTACYSWRAAVVVFGAGLLLEGLSTLYHKRKREEE